MRPSSVSRRQATSFLPNHQRTKSVAQSARYNAIHTQDTLKMKTSIDEIYMKRSSRKTSMEHLERGRRYRKSAKTSNYFTLNHDQQEKCRLIEPKYQSIAHNSPVYDYSRLYFPARYKYVKSSRKGRQTFSGFFRNNGSRNSLTPTFSNFTTADADTSRKQQKQPNNYLQKQVCMGPKLKIVMKTKKKGMNGKRERALASTQAEVPLSPWETCEQL